jgi:hypothetical protein
MKSIGFCFTARCAQKHEKTRNFTKNMKKHKIPSWCCQGSQNGSNLLVFALRGKNGKNCKTCIFMKKSKNIHFGQKVTKPCFWSEIMFLQFFDGFQESSKSIGKRKAAGLQFHENSRNYTFLVFSPS